MIGKTATIRSTRKLYFQEINIEFNLS